MKPPLSPNAATEWLPLSLLNDLLYCTRRAALKVVEGWRSGNQHTARGDIAHEHADLPGYEVAKGVKLLRALPVWSDRLGLNGKCDIVEVRGEEGRQRIDDGGRRTDEGRPPLPPSVVCPPSSVFLPVEFKIGKRRQWDNDDVQLCAQALCLEEMFRETIPRGAVFHADSKRRREVLLTAELRQKTEDAARALRELLTTGPSNSIPRLPSAVFKPACEECSLYNICLPKVTGAESRDSRLASQLFNT